jgi:prepilin-type processing-associated H-X9-DG protein
VLVEPAPDHVGGHEVSGSAAELRRPFGRIAKVHRSSELVLYFEGLPRSGNSFITVYQYWGDPSVGPAPFDPQSVGTMAESLLDTTYTFRGTIFDRLRHENRMNIGYVDGHVAPSYVTASQLQRVVVDWVASPITQ